MQVSMKIHLLLSMILLLLPIRPVVGLGVEDQAPDFTLVDIDGNSFTLSTCPAKVVLINFFTTLCGGCQAEIPTLRSLYLEYSRGDLEVISISPEHESTLQNFVQQQNIEYIVARDTAGVSYDYSVTYIPRTFLVNATGHILYDHTGWSGEGDALELRSKISSLLSGTENGDSDTGNHEPPYTLIASIAVVLISFLVIGIVVAGRILGWSKALKKNIHPSTSAEKHLSNIPV